MVAQRQETYSHVEMSILLLEQKNDSFYEMMKDLKKSHIELREEFKKSNAELREELRSSHAELRASIDRLSIKVDSNFKFLLTTMITGFVMTIGGFAGMFGIMAHGFHWIA